MRSSFWHLIMWASLRDSGPKGTEVEVEAAEARTVSSRVKATGEITPEKRVAISAKVVGEIINLPVDRGPEGQRPGSSCWKSSGTSTRALATRRGLRCARPRLRFDGRKCSSPTRSSTCDEPGA